MLIKEQRCRTKHVTHEERSRHKTYGTRVRPQKDLMMKQERVSTVMRTEERITGAPTHRRKALRKVIKYRKVFWTVSKAV